jgi:dipeptidyl aminopeptidase/acylaminoacyl peptidase
MRRREFLLGAMYTAGNYILAGNAIAEQHALGTIAYVQQDGLWIRELPDATPRRLVQRSPIDSPRFSPSGRWISCFCGDTPYVFSTQSGTGTALGKVARGSVIPGVQWTPTSDELLVRDESGLSIFSAENGWRQTRDTIAGAGLPVIFSPDGKEIVFAETLIRGKGSGGEPMMTGRLCRLPLQKANGACSVLTANDLSNMIPAVWMRNGKIIFWENPEFSADVADGLELFQVSADGGHPRSLGISTLVHDKTFSFSPNWDKLAVGSGDGRDEWEDKRIAIIDTATDAFSYLTGSAITAVSPSWSPDGTAIAYSAAPSPSSLPISGGEEAKHLLAKRHIWVSEVRGGTSAQLTNDARYRDEEPIWSADGKNILFCRIDKDDNKTLWLMESHGTPVTQVAGSLYIDPGLLGVNGSWFGYYGHIT